MKLNRSGFFKGILVFTAASAMLVSSCAAKADWEYAVDTASKIILEILKESRQQEGQDNTAGGTNPASQKSGKNIPLLEQDRRAKAIPYNGRVGKKYDYAKAVILKDTRIFSIYKKPTTDFFLKHTIVSVHNRYNKTFTTHAGSIYYVTGWSRDDLANENDGLIPGSAIQLLSKTEYARLYERLYPVYVRKADAALDARLLSVPGRGRTRHVIGPSNKYGGDKNFEVVRRSLDWNWYKVRYWTGELGGYREGWAPKNALKIMLTEGEAAERKKLAEEKLRIAKMKNDALRADELAKAMAESIKEEEEEAKKEEEEAEKRAANQKKLEFERKKQAAYRRKAEEVMTPLIGQASTQNLKYSAKAKKSKISILRQPDPFADVLAVVAEGEGLLVWPAHEPGWLSINYKDVQGFAETALLAIPCKSAHGGYLLKLSEYDRIESLYEGYRQYSEKGINKLVVRKISEFYILGIGPFKYRQEASEAVARLKLSDGYSLDVVRDEIGLSSLQHEVNCF